MNLQKNIGIRNISYLTSQKNITNPKRKKKLHTCKIKLFEGGNMPRDKWGIHKKPYISWLGSHHRSRTKVSNKNAIRLDERRSNKQLQQNIEEKDDIDQLTKIIPRLQLETMAALVLVLVQDSSVALNLPRGPISQNRLAPPTPNVQKSTGGYLSKNNSKNTFCDQI